MSDYTYFYAIYENREGAFVEHQFVEQHGVCYLADALEEIDSIWHDKCGMIEDPEAYAKEILEPHLGNITHEEVDRDGEKTLQALYDFLMQWKSYKIMVFSEPHYFGA